MSYEARVIEVQYTDVAVNSDKYYRTYQLHDPDTGDYRVLFQWGRRGSKGQSNVLVCSNERQATVLVHKKLDEKMRKGYHEVYRRDLLGVDQDVLKAAGIQDTRVVGRVNPDPFVRLSVDTDTIRRLAMGDQEEVVQAITMRRGLMDQLHDLRNRVAQAEGELEVVDMLLRTKV